MNASPMSRLERAGEYAVALAVCAGIAALPILIAWAQV